MSKIVAALEDNPFPVKLTADSPLLTTLMCAAKHSKTFPKKWTRLLKAGPKGWNKLAAQLAAESDFDRAQLGTTTAVDVINGGSKVNSLPELVTSLVNFRIDFDESIGSVQGHVEKLISKVAKKSGLEFHAWQNGTDSDRFVSVDVLGAPLEPAPRTPSHGGVWDLFAGTVRDERLGGTERIVAPYASTGNTDCKMYYNLTKNVYRFMGNPDGSAANVHTVDERATAEGHIAIVRMEGNADSRSTGSTLWSPTQTDTMAKSRMHVTRSQNRTRCISPAAPTGPALLAPPRPTQPGRTTPARQQAAPPTPRSRAALSTRYMLTARRRSLNATPLGSGCCRSRPPAPPRPSPARSATAGHIVAGSGAQHSTAGARDSHHYHTPTGSRAAVQAGTGVPAAARHTACPRLVSA